MLLLSSFFLLIILTIRVAHEDIFIEMHRWLTAICQHIDTQDACLVDEVRYVFYISNIIK
jgi:hypothetical protein